MPQLERLGLVQQDHLQSVDFIVELPEHSQQLGDQCIPRGGFPDHSAAAQRFDADGAAPCVRSVLPLVKEGVEDGVDSSCTPAAKRLSAISCANQSRSAGSVERLILSL